MGKLIDAEQMLIDESEAYVRAQMKVGLATSMVNEVVHKKLLMLLADAPAVDAVEVVRCKDCVHRGVAFECPMCSREYNDDYDEIITDYAKDNGFCDRGERGTNEEESM